MELIKSSSTITREDAINYASKHGLELEVIYEMDYNHCSPYEALREWDLIPS